MGQTEKAPLFSDICTGWIGEILFKGFFCNVNSFILWYNLAISAKQTTRTINFYQTTKHIASDATQASAENVNERVPFW